MKKTAKILVTGASGLVGTALVNILKKEGLENVKGVNTSSCDLRDFNQTIQLFNSYKPEYVFHSAATVYGILGNLSNKGKVFLENIMINTNTIEASRQVGVKKIVCMGTGAVYPFPPKSMPLKEEELWYGKPHPSEDSYAQAKRAMLAQLMAYNEAYNLKYAYVISCNLFGPNDRFNVEDAHVIPSLVKKFRKSQLSKTPVKVWGTGIAVRDFLYSAEAARALYLIMNTFEGSINIGSGEETSIKEIVEELCHITGVQDVEWDSSKPDGQDRRMYDLSRLRKIGFTPEIPFKQALKETYNWFVNNEDKARV